MKRVLGLKVVLYSLIATIVACMRSDHHYDIGTPTFSYTEVTGLKIEYPGEENIELITVRYSINKPLFPNSNSARNVQLSLSSNKKLWTYVNKEIKLQRGDTLYYFVFVTSNRQVFRSINRQWTVNGEPSSRNILHKQQVECTQYPCVVFEDNFDTFNLSYWEHEITAGGGGNWEFQYYTNNRSNSYIRNGNLYIKPTLTSDKYDEAFLTSGTLELWGSAPPNLCTGNQYYGCSRTGTTSNYINPIQSARIRTVNSFSVRYGRIEVEAQMPKGDWLWPAIWMMPKHESYGGWPASGEIDIVESRGNRDLENEGGEQKGVNSAGQTLHWGPYWSKNAYSKTTADMSGTFGDGFHKYSVEWDDTQLRMLIDDVTVLTVDPGANGFWEFGDFGVPDESNPWRYSPNKMAPFDQEFYFIINLAVGGTNGYFPDTWTNRPAPKPWLNTSPTALRDFYLDKNNWYPTWNPTVNDGEDAALKINYVRVTKLAPDPAT